ncbi:MAG: TlpA family protein disulfide reductase [Nitrospinae bacterium]|nr:TlpA family protein disulfide reductase [Nitrospinota bacterium]
MKTVIFVIVVSVFALTMSTLGMKFGMKNAKIPNVYAPTPNEKLAPNAMMKVLNYDREIVIGGVIVVKREKAKPINRFIFHTDDGAAIDSATFKGKVTVVYLWGAHSRESLAEMPEIVEAYNRYSPRGFAVYGVALKTAKKELEEYLAKTPLPFPNAFMNEQDDIPIIFTPTTLILDKSGNVRVYMYGPLKTDTRTQILEKLLAEQ